MEEMLKQYGFVLNDGEWKRQLWTIRNDGKQLEAYNDNMYFCGDIEKVDLKALLEDIELFIEELDN